MAYYVFHLPSRTIPNRLTEINKSVYCFPSKEKIPTLEHTITFSCLCLVINADDDKKVIKVLKDFTIVQNIFGQNHHLLTRFSVISLSEYEKVNDSIENIYSLYKSDIRYIMTHFDYNKLPLLLWFNQPEYSFIEVFNKLHGLLESDFIYKSLSYLSIINPIIMITNRIYDNALLENALQFQLFESIMSKYDTAPTAKASICPTCKHRKQKGTNKRIDDFFNLENHNSLKFKSEFVASVKAVAKSRHIFSHKLEGKSHNAYYEEDIEPNLGTDKTIYLKEDIKYAHGSSQAVQNVKALNVLFLIDKLLNTNGST
jgi:hypothetical protein